MPNNLTHILVARGAFKNIEDAELSLLLSNNFHAYLWGAQGPDLLMHTGYWPWHRISNLAAIGIRMHKRHINDVFERFYRHIREQQETPEFEPLWSYYLGFITHHAVDSIFHPYIYGAVERLKGVKPRFPRNSLHYGIEENIDLALLNWIYQETPYQFSAYKVLLLSEEVYRPVARMYRKALGSMFGRHVREKEIVNAFKDMRMVQKFIFDPGGIKCEIMDFLDDINGKGKSFSYMTHRKKLDDRIDYCNLGRNTWHYPADASIQSDADIFELYEKAVAISAERIREVCRRLREGVPTTGATFGNISYDTGLSADRHTNSFE